MNKVHKAGITQLVQSAMSSIESLKGFNLSTKPGKQAIGSALSSLSSAHDQLNGRVADERAIRNTLDYAYNYVKSIADCVADGDTSVVDLPTSKKQVLSSLSSVLSSVEELKPPEVKPADDDAVETAAGKVDYLAGAGSKITRFSRYKSLMPSASSSKSPVLKLLQLPIVVVFDPFLTVDDLTKAGFSADTIGMYIVLEEQTIVALNVAKLKEKDTTVDEYLKDVMESLEAKTSKKWILPIEYAMRYSTSGYVYYWAIEQRMADRLFKAHPKASRVGVDEWGFAF